MKKIVSLTLGLSFLIMSYTGVFLFLCPQGRIAYWSDWHMFGLSKTQYGELHATSFVIFMLFGMLHIYYNWKPIVSYMKDKSKKISFTKKEFLIALTINIVFVIGTLFMVEPFKVFLKMENNIKDSWIKEYGEPPYGHAEETKLKAFCRKLGIDLEYAKSVLVSQNIIFKENESLKTIAQNNSISPNRIYELIEQKTISKSNGVPDRLGRKTLQILSDMKKIDLNVAMKILSENGLNDIDSGSKIKNIADDLDILPVDVYNMIIKKDK